MVVMKHKSRESRPDRDLRRLVKRLLPLIPTDHAITKSEFEKVLDEVIACVHKKTGAGAERLRQATDKVLADLPKEYGGLPKRERSWPALITYLYSKYLRELREPRKEPG